ncbi:MAG: ChaN family lipoprotein [Betaproteobacteria bacterium]|nr:ChaN family lipoprotein [Betaproteobacteria bacterium]
MLPLAAFAQGEHRPVPGASAQTCLVPGAWHRIGEGAPRPLSGAEALALASDRDIVLLGEKHDEYDHHAWQLQTLAALYALRPQMVIGFEAFPRRAQAVLDQWVAGELSEAQFLARSEWDKVWSLSSRLYMPLFQFARINRIPMVALNVDRELTQQITQQGWDGVPAERREGVSRPAQASQAYRDTLFEIYKEHPRAKEKTGEVRPTDPDFLHFVDSQTTWDRAMAEALARRLRVAPGNVRPVAIGILGAGHVRNGHGVPYQLRDLGVSSIATLVPVEAADGCKLLTAGFADAVFALPTMPQEAPRKPRLGISLQRTDKGIEVIEVIDGSLAESTGIRKGDAIVSVAGAVVTQIGSVTAAVRSQPAGTWLPMTVRREGTTHELMVKFPPQS